jgi:hypothetical protein
VRVGRAANHKTYLDGPNTPMLVLSLTMMDIAQINVCQMGSSISRCWNATYRGRSRVEIRKEQYWNGMLTHPNNN